MHICNTERYKKQNHAAYMQENQNSDIMPLLLAQSTIGQGDQS